MTYKGYEINGSFIYKDGKEVFIGTWRQDRTEADAMRLIDKELSSIVLVKLPELKLPRRFVDDCCELENGSEQREREIEAMNNYFEMQNEQGII